MMFFSPDRITRVLSGHFGNIRRANFGSGYSLSFEAEGRSCSVIAPEHAAVGKDAHQIVHNAVADRIGSGGLSFIDVNAENIRAPYAVTFGTCGATRHYPVSAQELDNESDLLDIFDSIFGLRASLFNPRQQFPTGVRRFLMEAIPRQTREETVRASQMLGMPDSYFLDIIPPEEWMEEVGVFDYLPELRYTYDPGWASLYEEARHHGRSSNFKLVYAAHWNEHYTNRYWRLRACVIEDRMTFRMPFCITRSNARLLGRREIAAMEKALSNRFEMPRSPFAPRRTDSWIDLAIAHIAASWMDWSASI